MRIFSSALLLFILTLTTAASACGPDADCILGDRHYRIAMPEGHDGATPVGAIVFAHGYRGSARGVMRNGSLRRLVSDMGLALIAVKSAADDWVLPNAPRRKGEDGSVEFDYFDAVIADASARFAIDTDRMMMTGFSAGGMMVWNLACSRPDMFAGFVPVSGTFWLEPPAHCTLPATSVIHIHGDADPTVPLTGRPIADTHQGDVAASLDMYTAFGGFGPQRRRATETLDCVERTNTAGRTLSFCLFEGGHSFRSAFVKFGWDSLVDWGDL